MKRILIILILLFGLAAMTQADETALLATAAAGQTAEYHFELRNDSDTSHVYQLRIEGLPSEMSAVFSQGGPILEEVSVDAQGYGAVFLRIEIPFESTAGHYEARVIAERDDGEALNIPLGLTVDDSYSLRISSQSLNVSTFSGKDFAMTVTATNTGASTLNNLSLSIEVPTKWLVQMNPTTIASLPAGESASFEVSIYVSPSQVAIEQNVKMHLISDEAISPETSVLVRVENNPDFLIYAVLLVGAAILGTFFYFRLKGRR